MTDLRDQFAGLRADETARLRPPGTTAIRETVRRRTRRRRSMAAGLAAVALTGGFAVAGIHRTGDDDTPATVPNAVLLTWVRQQIATVKPTTVVASSAELLDAPFGTSGQSVTPGEYTTLVSCAGMGAAVVTVSVRPLNGGDEIVARRGEIECDEASPGLRPLWFTVTVPGNLSVLAHPNAAALDRAALAYLVYPGEDKSWPQADTVRAARQRLGERHRGPGPRWEEAVYKAGRIIDGSPPVTSADTVEPGTYRFMMACAGTGSIGWRLRLESSVDNVDRPITSGSVSCDASKPVSVPIELDRGLARVDLQADAAAVTAGAGWALQIYKD